MTSVPSAAGAPSETPVLPDLLNLCAAALGAADDLYREARVSVGALVKPEGRIDSVALDANQFAVHGFAWFATYVESLREMLGWARRLEDENRLAELETLILQAAFGEYLSQMTGGIAMSQVEVVRPADMGVGDGAITAFETPAVKALCAHGNTAAVRTRIAELITDGLDTGNFGDLGLDETLGMIRDQFHRFADEQVAPFAHDWHLKDDFIPMSVIDQMSELGVFGLTIPEEHGGLGLGKIAMCVVTEELSRGYIGV
ncbi:MAG: acyl-CoA dehydrogenase family protein, partial [Rhodospirillales bacterium]|nr:acyl-CoA dehydrogenase family protein [Rhodospirillales bacterium]